MTPAIPRIDPTMSNIKATIPPSYSPAATYDKLLSADPKYT